VGEGAPFLGVRNQRNGEDSGDKWAVTGAARVISAMGGLRVTNRLVNADGVPVDILGQSGGKRRDKPPAMPSASP